MEKYLEPYRHLKLVLGFSGGPDSLALFRAAQKAGVNLVLAHVDHGWRGESRDEAAALQKFAAEEGVSFYLKTFSKSDFSGNLEQDARVKRLEFFRQVVEETQSAGVLLGHHAGDAGETSLKRLLEGAPLYALESLKKESRFEGLLLIRPFLEVAKEQLLEWVADERYFLDPGNTTGEFLRGRMRSEMIPFLSDQLGKNVTSALAGLGAQSAELQDYIESLSSHYPWKEEVFGGYIDFTSPPHPFVLKALIHRLYKRLSLRVSKKEIVALAEAILQKKNAFTKEVGEWKVVAHGGYLMLLNVKRNGELTTLSKCARLIR